MDKTARLIDLHRRFLRIHNENGMNDEVIHNSIIESSRYGVSINTFKRDIRYLKKIMLDIAKRDYQEELKTKEDFYVFLNVIEFNKAADVYWMHSVALHREQFEKLLRDEELEKKRKQFIMLSQQNANENKLL